MKNVDTDKSGFLKYEVFFELLDLHKIKLNKDATNYLKKHYSKNQTINYKEALNQITIDLQAAGGQDESGTDGQLVWTVQALQKPTKSQIGGDSISQVGDGGQVMKPTDAKSVKSGGSFLSKDKLANLDAMSTRSKIAELNSKMSLGSQAEKSKVGSVAPSKMQSITQSKLAKIEEEEVEASPIKKTTKEDEKTQYIGEISKLQYFYKI